VAAKQLTKESFGTKLEVTDGKVAQKKLADRAFSKDIDETLDTVMQMMMMAMMLFFMIPMLPVAQAAQRYFQGQQYEGQSVADVLYVMPTLEYVDFIAGEPHVGLISASIHNDGWDIAGAHYAWSAFIGINSDTELHELKSGEDYHVNMAGADRRIEKVYYHANFGQRALVRLVGKY
jgi:hypothetical protein